MFGDENHADSEPKYITVTISPAEFDIPEQIITYNGENTFSISLDGEKVGGEDTSRTVIATLSAYSKNVGEYTYSETTGAGKYTIELSNSSYIVGKNTETLKITPLVAALTWSDPLTFTYDGDTHSVTVSVSNAIGEDEFAPKYEENTATEAGSYTAKVTDLGNENYTLDGAQNVTQPWYISAENPQITLEEVEPVIYGDEITLTQKITSKAKNSTTILAQDEVEFFVNEVSVGKAPVVYDNSRKDSVTATLKLKATSANNFSAITNAVTAKYGGNANVEKGEAAITVIVKPKMITASIAAARQKFMTEMTLLLVLN